MCGRSWNSSSPVFNIAKALDVNSVVEEDGIALLAKHVKLSVITGMKARMTEQIFALNALSGQGNCYWYDLYFQCYCFWQSYRLCRCLLATKSFFKNVGSVPKPEESECEGVCYSAHTAALETVIFWKPAGKHHQLITTWDWIQTSQHSGPQTLRHAWVNVHHVAGLCVSTWHSTLPEPWQQCYATLMDLYRSKDRCGETRLGSSSWPWHPACNSWYSTIAGILGPL